MNGLNSFERAVKDSLEPYEVPYNSADWAQLQRSLDQGKGSGRVSRSGLYALLLGGTIAAASTLMVVLSHTPGAGDGQTATMANSQNVKLASVAIDEAPTYVADDNSPTAAAVNAKTADRRPDTASPSTTSALPAGEPASIPPVKSAVPSTLLPLVRPSITEGCPGMLIDFAAENLPDGGIYLWNFGDGSFSNKPKPSHAFSKSGSFEVMLSHSSHGGGNILNQPAADRIVIHEAPEASFNLLKQEYDNTVPSVHFENRSLGGRTYEWDFGDGTTSEIAHPDHVYKKQGVYNVSLTVTNAKGCVDRSERTVRIDNDYDLLAPKTFSPNGDGMDDVYMPEALKSLGVKFHLSIFESKSGQLVYETSDAQRPWNGRVSNRGEACAPGDYVWMVEMKDGDKLGGTYNGSLSLVR